MALLNYAFALCICTGAEQPPVEIVPNPKVVAILHRLACLPEGISEEEKARFEKLSESQAEAETKKWWEERFAELDKAVDGNRLELVRQLFHFSSLAATNMEQAMLAAGLIGQMKMITKDEIASAMIPLLESNDQKVRKKAANWLRGTDIMPDDKTMDFQRYERILRTNKPAIPTGLVRYMFERAPRTALRTVVRVYEGEVSDAELRRKLDSLDLNVFRSSTKEELEYFAARSEWWAQLFVATVLWEDRAHGDWELFRRLLERLEKCDHPLVREKVSELKTMRF